MLRALSVGMLVAIGAAVGGCGSSHSTPVAGLWSIRVCEPDGIDSRALPKGCTLERMVPSEMSDWRFESIVRSRERTQAEPGGELRGSVDVCGGGGPQLPTRRQKVTFSCWLQQGRVEVREGSGRTIAQTNLSHGRFYLRLPAGRYELVAWNQGNGPWTRDVKIVAGDTTTTNFFIRDV
jgi:hypothetical protein